MSAHKTPKRFKDLAMHWPVNKVPANVDHENLRYLPEFTGKATIAALSVASAAVKKVLGNVKPTWVPGRTERFRQGLLEIVRESPTAQALSQVTKVGVRVDVHESFGKPVLVSVDILLPDRNYRLTEVRKLHHEQMEEDRRDRGEDPSAYSLLSEDTGEPDGPADFDPHVDLDPKLHVDHEEQKTLAVLLSDLLERVVEGCWDNPEIAPVAVRGRVVAVHDHVSRAGEIKHVRHHVGVSESETLVLDMRDLGYHDEIGRVGDLYDRYGSPKSDPAWRP